MEFVLKDVFIIIGFVVTVVTTFHTTKHKLKEYTRDKIDELKKDINDLNLKVKELESKDELQQQVIDLVGKQIDDFIPKLVEGLKRKESNG